MEAEPLMSEVLALLEFLLGLFAQLHHVYVFCCLVLQLSLLPMPLAGWFLALWVALPMEEMQPKSFSSTAKDSCFWFASVPNYLAKAIVCQEGMPLINLAASKRSEVSTHFKSSGYTNTITNTT